jgi:CubicO group peptidase (beta-lactamase class C family)
MRLERLTRGCYNPAMLSHSVAAALVALLLPAFASFAQAPPPPPGHASRVDDVFKDYAKPGSPGCAVGVYQDDRLVHSAAYGMANLDHDIPLTTKSVFHVASVSKQFTAAAILLLAQDGKLSIDDEVRKYVPELPDFGRRITIRHLVHHTSGIRDQWDLLGFAGWRYSRDLITDDDVLLLLSRQKDLNFTPGERHLYSNSGFTLLAIVVSRVSGKSFREFTSERIFTPLGMTNTHFRDNFNEIVKNQAYGYAPAPGGFRLSVTNFDTAGATSLLTTVEDMAKWHANFDSHTVGGETLIPAMLERGVLNNGQRIDYASGIGHGTYRGLPTVGHGGADAGYRSAFLRFPEQRFGVATLCNLATTNPTLLTQRVAGIYLGGALKPEPTAPAEADQPEVPLPADQLARLAGLYWNEKNAVAMRFVVEGGRLHAVFGTSRNALKSLGGGRFVRTQGPGPQVTFDVTGGGGQRVTMGTPSAPDDALTRVEPFAPTAAQLKAFAGVYRSDEIDLLYRVTLKDGTLRVERLKAAPVPLEPLVRDTFRAQFGIVRFTRDNAGAVTGCIIEAGRIRGLTFWKEPTPMRPSTAER